MPGLSFDDWRRDHPNEPCPISIGIGRGFPARYAMELNRCRLDSKLLRMLGLDKFWEGKIRQTVKDAPWFPIADDKCMEGKFGTCDDSLGGHPVPSHGFMFGYRAVQTWNDKVYGPLRLVRQFDEDNGDGMREDDLYGLIHLPFQFTPADPKKTRRHLLVWYHPDKCKQRAVIERQRDESYEYPQREWDKATKKCNWRKNALGARGPVAPQILEFPHAAHTRTG